MKKTIFFAALILLLCGCTEGPLEKNGAQTVPVTGVTLDKEDVRIFLGHEMTLNATISPSDATNKALTWNSSDNSVVTVADGLVKAVGLGDAVVTVTTDDGGFSAECSIRVTEECQTQTKGPMTLDLGEVTATTVIFNASLDVNLMSEYQEVGFVYSTERQLDVESDAVTKVRVSREDYSERLTGLLYDTEYNYAIYLLKNGVYQYGETQKFKTDDIIISVADIKVTNTTATFVGIVIRDEADVSVKVGIQYSEDNSFGNVKTLEVEPEDDGTYSVACNGLDIATEYCYRTYVCQNGVYEYSETMTFTTSTVSVELEVESKTQTTAMFTGSVSLTEEDVLEVGLLYSSSSSDPKATTSGVNKVVLTDLMDADGNFTHKAEDLLNESTHYYRYYIKQGSTYTYGDVKTFKTEKVPVTIAVESIDKNVVTFKGNVQFSEAGVIEIGIQYYPKSTTSQSTGVQTKAITRISGDGDFAVEISQLLQATEYYWQYYLLQDGVTIVGQLQTFKIADLYNVQSDLNMSSALDLSSSASANCYMISNTGLYKFKTVKGNSSESVGSVASASILWETFGTSTTPDYLDLIDAVCYKDGYIAFQIADMFKEGNAVIAAKDADGNILWSWHIWLTDQPQEHVYKNNAGTMMDRNLGATSATPGDVGALGLLYQWGRKDPFLGSSSIGSSTLAESTITWPSAVETSYSVGTVEYVTSHPTTFVTSSSSTDYDWHYSSRDNTLWTTSENAKSIYDPCPAGWRVPDGGSGGVWSKATGSSSDFTRTYDSTNEGVNFSGKFGSASTIWYPGSGCRGNVSGSLFSVGAGFYWSASPYSHSARFLVIGVGGYVYPSDINYRAYGQSVRCLQAIDEVAEP